MTDDDNTFKGATAAVKALAENADRLGLTWSIRPATVTDYDFPSQKAKAIYDGDTVAVSMVSLCGGLLPNVRVMAMQVPPSANFALSPINIPIVGTLVIRLRATASQSIADAGAGEFVQWATAEHDWYGTGFTSEDNTKYRPPMPGWYLFNGRIVWTANATSRRGVFLNINGTTGAPGSFGGTSLQAPATGSCQLQCAGSVYLNGETDYVGLRALQNSGAPLTLSPNTDGGSVLEGFYMGAYLPRAS